MDECQIEGTKERQKMKGKTEKEEEEEESLCSPVVGLAFKAYSSIRMIGGHSQLKASNLFLITQTENHQWAYHVTEINMSE